MSYSPAPFTIDVRFGWRHVAIAAVAAMLAVPTARSLAQSGAVTVTGRVTSGDSGVVGASVRIQLPGLTATVTGSTGEYRLIVPSSQVLGQTVVIEATHRKFGTGRAELVLKGGQIVQDIALTAGVRPSEPTRPNVPASLSGVSIPTFAADSLSAATTKGDVDGTPLADLAGPIDVVSALAGRIPGMVVTSANTSGASALAVVRGAHSISGTLSPLYVIDGVPMANSTFASTVAERFGLGGFDLGSPLGDLSLQDIANVRLLSAAQAAPLYGSRAANGVVLITTRNGEGTDGLAVFAQRQSTTEKPLRLPTYQNQYGQGLGGQFSFFDGKGGGINDGVAESWGPALDGQPLPQASYTERGRADVRLWKADPAAVGNFFGAASTILVGGGVQGSSDWGSFRGSVNASNSQALTPGSKSHRLGGMFSGTLHPFSRLLASANIQAVGTKADNRPGTGFDDVNPVSAFVTLPRQVNLDSLRLHLRDATGQQINWIYTGVNNPTFQTSQNTNRDLDETLVAGGLLQYQLSSWLSGTMQGGVDHYHADRAFKVAAGWSDGYPTALGRGDFSGGGTQAQTIRATQTTADFALVATSSPSHRVHGVYTVGLETRSFSADATSDVLDIVAPVDGGSAGGSAASNTESASGTVVSMYGTGVVSLGPSATLNAGIRRETSTSLPSGHNANLYPAVSGTFDLLNGLAGFKRATHLSAATLRASWWQSGNEVTEQTLARTYAGQGTALAPVVGVLGDSRLRNEQTNGMELGTTLMASRNVGIDVAAYRERSSNLLIPEIGTGTATTLPSAAPTGTVVNTGVELQLHTVLLRDYNGVTWDATTSYASNHNRVDALNDTATEVPLGPALWGASVVARQGSPVGSIIGRRFLRDGATHALILKDGLPLPDMSGDPAVLGSWQPTSTGSIASSLHFRGAEIAVLLDGRFGGKIFSATNYWGSYSGTLESTVDRPVGGRVIAGIDSATGAANTTAVTTEQYNHALGPITEAWVYSASFMKLREFRISYTLVLPTIPYLAEQKVNVALVTRNLWMWAKVPNIDPETTYGVGAFQGVEMGQLPNARSVGLRLSITP